MKKLLLAIALCFISSAAFAQCNGVFPANTLCGNLGPSAAPPHPISNITSTYGPTSTTQGDAAVWAGLTGGQLADAHIAINITAPPYNALGNSNGTTGSGQDNTGAFQSALLNTASNAIYVPCGIYRITNTISTFAANKVYKIYGEGYCSQIYLDSGSAKNAFNFAPISLCNAGLLPCLTVRGINFITPTTSGTGTFALSIQNEQGAVVQDNFFSGYTNATEIISSYGPRIDGNTFYNLGSIAIFSPSYDASFNEGRISGNKFYAIGFQTSSAAVNIGTTNGGLVISNNDCEVNYACFIFNGGSIGVLFTSNYMEGQTGFDAYWNGTNAGWTISGNRFASGLTIQWVGLTNSTIDNNVIGGGAGTISFDTSSQGNLILNNVVQAGATFAVPDYANNNSTGSYGGIFNFFNTLIASAFFSGTITTSSINTSSVIAGTISTPTIITSTIAASSVVALSSLYLPQSQIPLPTCSSSNKGNLWYISNGVSPATYNAAVSLTVSGTTPQPVFCNGTNWTYH